MSLLFFIAGVACILLAWRLASTNKVVTQLIHSAKTSEPVILPGKTLIGRHPGLDELVKEFNRLLKEKTTISGEGGAYHGQIQALLGNLREAVVMADQSGLIQSVNPAFLELAQIQKDPTATRLVSIIKGTQFLEFVRSVQANGPGRLTEINVRINKASRWLEVSAAPMEENAETGQQYTLFIFHDITRQKQLEKMRTEFVANVSHELRTPVTIIKGFAETLIEDDAVLDAKDKKRFLKKICNNSDRLHRLVEDLMLITRLESTDMVLHLEMFSLNKFLEELADNWRSSQQLSGPELYLELDTDINLKADPLRLSQVVGNLLDNAHRHGKGATSIRLSSKLYDKTVCLTVSDNGAGVPEKDLPHIFQRFFRVEKGRSRELGGTGLGLSIVKHIVAQHGGKVSAKSKMGEGTQIEVLLPLHPVDSSTAV